MKDYMKEELKKKMTTEKNNSSKGTWYDDVVRIWERRKNIVLYGAPGTAIPGDIYHDAYQQGLALGEYNIDAELAKKAEKGDNDSITLLEERKSERAEKDLRMKLFGI